MSWPTAVATDAELFVAKNNFQTTLNGAIDASTTTVVLTSVSGLPTSGYVTIGTEAIKYTGIAVNTLTGVTRGADSTTAATHANGDAVFAFIVANHHNVLKEEIKAVETSLDLTASRAVVTSASGRVAAATTTSTEIGYVNGVTSAIQTQIDTKAPSASPTFTGTVTTPVTASRALVTGASSELAAATTTATEIGYVNGVTSAIQTQINTKAPTASPTFSGTITTPLTASRALTTGASSELAISATTATELGYVNGVTSALQTQMDAKAPLASPTFTGTVTVPKIAASAQSYVVCDTGNGHGGTSTKIRRFTNRTQTGTDITVADDANLGTTFTVNTAGFYFVFYADYDTGATVWMGVSKNTPSLTTNIQSVTVANGRLMAVLTPAAGSSGQVCWGGYLAASDVIRAHDTGSGNMTTDSLAQFTIVRVF